MINSTQRIGYIPQNGGNGNGNSPGVWEWLVTAWNWLVQSGFFDTGQWFPDIVGQLTDDHATGGPLDELQEQVGVEFPDLQALRQAVVDAWRGWQRSVLIRKPALLAYREAVKQFAIAFDEKKAEYLGGTPPVPIAGILEWLKTNWKTLALVGSVLGVGTTVAVVIARRK
ncbi:unnamed protein product [marine sediment metagenome]|uniref:Uncharacterized protein n=1 Tax=marine sediment metagenome TaxID=412755 RepID=X1U7B5_9ZZZZ